MLQALAARLQARRAAGGNDDEEGDEGDQPIILGENCQVRFISYMVNSEGANVSADNVKSSRRLR